MAADPRSRPGLPACLGLVALVFLVYGRAAGFAFTNFDDPLYVTGNRHVRAGLGWEGLRWAFTTHWAANWHPVTWLSHMADVSLFGLAPGPHHLVGVALHAANAVLLFLLLRAMTRAFWPSLATAALFAVHPLHVESVAWIAERKDLLSMCFGLLALGAWVRFVRTGSRLAYGGALALFALALMAKPMLVSLPLLMLCLDFWPLRRGPRLLEKVPFAVLSALSCAATVLAQRSGGAVLSVGLLPLRWRLLNAAASYGRYLAKAVRPVDLAAFYPMQPPRALVGTALASLAALALLSWAAWNQREKRPYLLAGWAWYLVSLVPVIGVVQVGFQGMADRYTYLPLVGPMFAAAWLCSDWARERALSPWVPGLAAGAAVAALSASAWFQAGTWRNSETLFRHAVAVDPSNYVARTNLGFELYTQGRCQEALPQLVAAAAIMPGAVEARYFLGRDLVCLGRREEALAAFRKTLDLAPRHDGAIFEAACVLVDLDRGPEAAGLLLAYQAGAARRAREEGDPEREKARSLQAQAMLDLIRARHANPTRKPE